MVNTAATCTDEGSTVYTATATFEGESYTDSVTVAIPATDHDYKFDSFIWSEDCTSAQAKLVCANDPSHEKFADAIVTSAFTAATCENDAFTVYTAKYGESTETKTIVSENTALDHDYRFDSFVWSDDGTSATVKLVCANDASHIKYENAVIAKVDYPATAEKDAYTVYTASYGSETATNTVVHEGTALGHDYVVKFVWADDNTCTAVITDNNSATYILEVSVPVIVNSIPASCTSDGTNEYSVTFEFDGRTYTDSRYYTVPAIGHTPGEAVIENASEAVCDHGGQYDVVVYCSVCKEEISRETVTVAAPGHTPVDPVTENVVAATCEVDGSYDEVVYCAICSVEISRNTVAIPATGHDYKFDSFVWSEDGTKAQAKLICANDASHIVFEDAQMSLVEFPATTETDAYTVYTAKYGDSSETNTVVDEGTALGHDYVAAFEWTDEENVRVTFTDNNDPEFSSTVPAVVTVETVPATSNEEGKIIYTATAIGPDGVTYIDTRTVSIPKLPHDYVVNFTWADDNTATVTVTDNNDPSYVYSGPATVTSETTPSTCLEKGNTVYTASAAIDGRLYSENKTVELPLADHTPGNTVIENASESVCEEGGRYDKVIYCAVCGEELSRETVTVEALGHTPADATVENVVPATCEEAGSYDSVVYCAVCKAELSRTAVSTPANGHEYKFDSFVWSEDGTTAGAKLICANDASHITYEDAVMSSADYPATAEKDAYTVYTATYGDETDTNTVVFEGTALGHDYVAEFTWTDDYKATVKFTDNNDPDFSSVVEAEIKIETTPATSAAEGKTVYTAFVTGPDGETYTDAKIVVIPKLDNDFVASFTWNDDNTVIVTVTDNNDPDFIESIPATVTIATTSATCEEEGKTQFTATAQYEGMTFTDTKTVAIPATGHDYRFDSFIWSEDGTKAQVKLVCENDASHVKYEDAEVSSETVAATAETDAYTVYTATFGEETDTNTVVDEGTALGHEYVAAFTWSDDNSSASVTFTDKNDPAYSSTSAANVTTETTSATSAAEGKTVYTASVTGPDGKTYTDTKTVTIPKLDPDYEFVRFEWSEDGASAIVVVKDRNNNGAEVKLNATVNPEIHPATCTDNAYTVYTAVYGYNTESKTVYQTGSATGHKWGTWHKLDENKHIRECQNNASHTQTAAHKWNDGVITKPATATSEGLKTYTCIICGAAKTEKIAKLGFILGDVNLDKQISAEDARLALRQAVKLEHFAPNSQNFINADVNFDNEVTADDARSILRAAVKLEDPADWLKNMK